MIEGQTNGSSFVKGGDVWFCSFSFIAPANFSLALVVPEVCVCVCVYVCVCDDVCVCDVCDVCVCVLFRSCLLRQPTLVWR